jgi:hypothetical protein
MLNPTLPDVIAPGDMIAVYAGDDTPIGAATVETFATTDHFTPDGYVTLWTTMGRFDVPAGAQLDVMAWAPLTPLVIS